MAIIMRVWRYLGLPSARYSFGFLVGSGMVLGVAFWGAFNTAVSLSNTETFCISCHEMRDTVYQEMKGTIHFSNRTGVRATCPDCHVPKEWGHKILRKIYATNELYHKILGSVNTPEKFEAKRLEMAKRVWASMRATDSRECRNCHNWDYMKLSSQKKRTRVSHEDGRKEGKTCIDCHKGISHKKPKDPDEDKDEGGFKLSGSATTN